MQVETLQYDIKALQEEVDDEKAEQETPLYVGYIRCMYATILSFPRLQIYSYISICMSLSRCSGNSTTGGGVVGWYEQQ